MEILKGTRMNILDYTGYFHDGEIDSIKHENNTVYLAIESCEIIPEWGITQFSLTEDRTIKGKLILTDVKNIFVNRELSSDINRADAGEILDLIINRNKLELGVIWSIYKNKGRDTTFEYIIFEFKNMIWIEHDKEA